MNLVNILLLLERAAALGNVIGSIGSTIQLARDEGRDVTDAELDDLAAKDDAARQVLADLIAAKRQPPTG